MFRRLRDQVSSAADAASAALGIGGDEKVQTLVQMGFDAESARHALAATDGNVDRAAELLLLSGGASQQHGQRHQQRQQPAAAAAGTAAAPIDVDDDEQVRRVMEESRRAEEERRMRAAREESLGDTNTNANANGGVNRTAAVANAGRAALARFEDAQGFGTTKNKGKNKKKNAAAAAGTTDSNYRRSNTAPPSFDSMRPNGGGGEAVRMKSGGLTTHHPNVKVPKRLADKTKEERLLRCADRLKPHPFAVDTLLVALTAVRSDPANERYRKVDKTTAGYVRTLKDRPGAEDMLLAMNFRRHGSNELRLDRPMVDDTLLYLGISALEQVRESEEYKEGKRIAKFVKELNEIRRGAGNDSEAEAVRRAECMAKCPSEPSGGAGALIQLTLGEDVVRRRFDGDDVLNDVTNWIGGHGSAIPEKLAARDWCLVDVNRYPPTPIDTVKNAQKTLQFIGCWPSGRLEVRPSPDNWKTRGTDGGAAATTVMGSSRGLGSAPTSELH